MLSARVGDVLAFPNFPVGVLGNDDIRKIRLSTSSVIEKGKSRAVVGRVRSSFTGTTNHAESPCPNPFPFAFLFILATLRTAVVCVFTSLLTSSAMLT